MYKLLIRPIFFLFDPEKIHHFTFSLLRFINKIPLIPSLLRGLYIVEDSRLERTIFGLTFKNPVGLAAGFDKDAKLYNELGNLGFEIGRASCRERVWISVVAGSGKGDRQCGKGRTQRD